MNIEFTHALFLLFFFEVTIILCIFAADYATKKKQFADGLREALPNTETWARSCADCEECLPKCPQQIRIPNQMARIVELLRQR